MLEQVYRWSTAKKLGSSRLLRTSYFWLFVVPLAAHVLSQLGDVVHLSLGGSPIQLQMGLPFSWKLFYFGAVAFSIGGLIFASNAPAIVRDYDTVADYISAGKGGAGIVRELSWYVAHASTLRVEVLAGFVEKFLRGSTRADGSPQSTAFWSGERDVSHHLEGVASDDRLTESEKQRELSRVWFTSALANSGRVFIAPDSLGEAFWYTRDLCDYSRPRLILATNVCYAIAYLCYFFVTCQGFYYVCRMLLR